MYMYIYILGKQSDHHCRQYTTKIGQVSYQQLVSVDAIFTYTPDDIHVHVCVYIYTIVIRLSLIKHTVCVPVNVIIIIQVPFL